jgi:XTP/dITP diphosphohydrolase
MKTLLFASQNKNKVKEIQSVLEGSYLIKSLQDVGFNGELDEPFNTFAENAKTKAKQGYDIFSLPCFAEDAGLVIEALNGRPGVMSARYAGDVKSPQANIDKVLDEMQGIVNRTAYFIALIAFYTGSQFHLFEGRIYGTILDQRVGSGGFGYDPIFLPEGYNQSFGELSAEVKTRISHRSIAVRQFTSFIKENANNG